MSLCFLAAFTRWKSAYDTERRLTDGEFLDHILAHFRGECHKEDGIPSCVEPLVAFEPWLASFREVALSNDYKPLEGKTSCTMPSEPAIYMDTDTSYHKKILELCLEGQFEEVKVALTAARAFSMS